MADALLRIDDLRRRVQKDSASLAFAQLGEELRRAGELDEAIRVCRAGLEYHPEYVSARVTLGRALLASNSLDDAFNELSGVLRTAPENLAALRGLGETHQRRGDQAAALTVFRRALALAPHDAELAALVSAIQPSVPAGNGDNRRWPPPSGSHLIAKPTPKTGSHPVAKVTPPTGRHPIGPIGLPVNEIEVRQPIDGDAHTAALDLLGAPPSDAEREHLGLPDERADAASGFDAAEARSATTQLEATPDLHDLLASQPMADDRITPDAREMLASWSVPPIEPPPVPVEPPPAPVDPLPADAPPSLPMMLEPAPAAPMLDLVESPEPELTLAPSSTLESALTPPLMPPLMLTAEETDLTVEAPPLAAEPPTPVEEGSQSSIRLVARTPASVEPELNPIEAAQVELLERWLESIKAARDQDHNPAQ